MRAEHQGISVWYGTPEAPAPGTSVQAGTDVTITIGVQPADASNKLEVCYRVNQGPIETVAAQWLWNDLSSKAQYFRAHLPAFRTGDTVEYRVVCRCAGRQVPSPDEESWFPSSFRVRQAGGKSEPDPESENPSLQASSIARSALRGAIPPVAAVANVRLPVGLRDDDGDGEPDPSYLTIDITSPLPDANIGGLQPGTPLTVSGTVDANRVTVTAVNVQVGNFGFPATFVVGQTEITWSCNARVYAPGQITILASVKGTTTTSPRQERNARAKITVNVTLQSLEPDLEIKEPTASKKIEIGESGSSILLQAKTSDQFGPRSVTWQLDSPPSATGAASQDPASPTFWNGQVFVSAMPIGQRTITVRCRDVAGNEAVRTVAIIATDGTAPHFEIIEPGPDQVFVGGQNGMTTVTVRGRARDLQSGMIGGQAAVEWSLNGRLPFTRAVSGDNWANWQADVTIDDYGSHVIHFKFTDRDGNSIPHLLPLQVVSSYKPKDVEERLSPRAYLEDLLKFARDHITVPEEGPLSSDKLRDVFHQPFGKLSQPLSDVCDQPVNQLRVVVEVLRKYLSLKPSLLAAHWKLDSSEWGWAALDESGHNHTGSIVSETGAPITFVDGHHGGKALSLNGIGQYVHVNNTSVLEVGKDNTDFSVAFSVYLRQGATGAWRSIMHKGNNTSERTFALWWHPQTNRLHARISTEHNWNDGVDTSAEEIPLHTWTHVAYVKSGKELKLYVNGTLDSRVTLQGKTVSNNGPIFLGKDPWHPGFDGALDNVRIYNIALSEHAVRAIANGAPGDPVLGIIAGAEPKYRQAAYEALLAGMGTSYEELRLMRGAAAETRQALADRLGIRLTASMPDELEQLTLHSGALTEAALETLFGLKDTDLSKDPLRPTAKPQLLEWRENRLRALWMHQDHPESQASQPFPVLIDPDLIDIDDLTIAVKGNTAFDILQDRQQIVQGFFDRLKGLRETQPQPLAGFDAVIADTLPGTDLTALDAEQRQGKNIETALRSLHLTQEMFSSLIRVRNLAQRGIITDEEWEDVYHILTQVKKRQNYANWRVAEMQVSLTPDSFKISSATKELLPWRATAQARQDWQDLLQARIDQKRTLTDAFYTSVAAAEEVALPKLRDALVMAFDGADWLSGRLFVDVKGSGALRTTRIMQAVETLQSMVFTLRTLRFAASHPASTWTINEDEDRFDTEWKWMGSYGTWRTGVSVLLHPENFLLPNLRSDQTQPFKIMLQALRNKQHITPEEARQIAAVYVADYLGNLQQDLPRPVAHWKFDEGNGDQVNDSSGNGNTGTRQGAIWDIGQIGSALSFDGLDDKVAITTRTEALKNLTNTFTLSLWVNPRSTYKIDREATTGTSGTFGQKYAIGPLHGATAFGANHAGGGVSVGTNGVSVYEHSANYLPAVLVYEAPILGWTHVAVVYNDRKPSIYINGRLVKAGEQQSSQAYVHACPDGLGGMDYGYFQGQLDDVRIYTQALSPDELELLAFRMTDQRSAADLNKLRVLCEKMLGQYRNPALPKLPYLLENTPVYLKEIFYFAPLQLALQLQKSGEYLAALDWYQTVYAYNLLSAERKVYYGLKLEQNRLPDLSRRAHWTRDLLDIHAVATWRPNPYTRFTLMSLARCCLEFADTEFTRDTAESLAKARTLYTTARDLLMLPELQLADAGNSGEVVLPNPVLEGLRARAEMQLAKLRQGRNIAGMKRMVEIPLPTQTAGIQPAASGDGQLTAPPSAVLRPTPYYYRVLIERSKQLVNLAQQIEAAYLNALESFATAKYRRFEANGGLELADAGVELQMLRVKEGNRGVTLAQKQKNRSEFLKGEYNRLINAGPNAYEQIMLNGYWDMNTLRTIIAGIDAAIGAAQFAGSATSIADLIGSGGAKQWIAVGGAAAYAGKAVTTGLLNYAEASLQVNALQASHARRVEEWRLQKGIAEQDSLIAAEQILMAQDHTAVVSQEERIARTQAAHAKALVDFLDNQFLNVEMYEWMSGVLAGVYRYFLQQATAIAKLAQHQLAFERQETPPSFIQADYWQPPADNTSRNTSNTKDRRGLTGSARLLQDIYQLDQYAFETNKRKLNLAQTFSLAQTAPLEFQRFRETGVLPFSTPMHLFDRGFPGHYLRLIKRVRTSVVALIPPHQGIRATLTASGISRVVVAGDTFREAVIRRDPELVALTSPIGATGVFEMDMQSDMLLPFEAMGVDTAWEFQMPKAANQFDYRTIADVLVTIEYTALHSFDYRQQVIQRLNATNQVSAERPFSFRNQFVDAWYDLLNPDQASTPMVVRFSTRREDFPPNLEDLIIQHVVLYLALTGEKSFADPVTAGLHVTFTTAKGNKMRVGGEAFSIDGLYSTRGNASSWVDTITGKTPLGEWELALSNTPEMRDLFKNEEVQDILFVLTYSGRTPAWPV